MLNVIYYYPLGPGAPSEVSRSIFSKLVNKNLPFSLTVFPQRSKGERNFKKNNGRVNILEFKDLFKPFNNGIIHFTMSPLVFPNRKFLLYLFSLLNYRKRIINYHGDPETEFKIKLRSRDLSCLLHLPNYLLTPYILKSADTVIVNSIFMKNLFKSRYNVKNIVVIPNGIDSSWLINFDAKYNMKDIDVETFSLFYHGRLAPEKGVDILIYSVYHLIREFNRNVKLYIAGEGSQDKYLKELCIKLQIEKNIVFLGHIPPREIKIYLGSVDAAIYPSIFEAFSLAVLEAFSTAKGPVLYSNKIGINDFVLEDGFTFYTFEPSIEEITNYIMMIIDKNYDEKISEKQKEFARKYTWDKVVDKYIEVYNNYL